MKLDERLTIIEQRLERNEKNIEFLIDVITKIIKHQNDTEFDIPKEELTIDTFKDIMDLYYSDKINNDVTIALLELIKTDSNNETLIQLADSTIKTIRGES